MKRIPSLATIIKRGEMGLAVFGGRKLSHAGVVYIYDAQHYFNTLVVESALDGRDLFFETDERDTLPASDYFEKLDTSTWS